MKGLLSLLLSSLIATGVILGSISTNIDAEDLIMCMNTNLSATYRCRRFRCKSGCSKYKTT